MVTPPTSATGNSNAGTMKQMHVITGARGARGFTLVELVVTLAVIGLLAGAVALTLPDENSAFRRESEDFAARLSLARDEAILSVREVQVSADARGYDTSRRSFDGWKDLNTGPFKSVVWRDETRPAFPGERQQATFRFDPTGGAQPAELQLLNRADRLRIRVDISGKVSVDGPG